MKLSLFSKAFLCSIILGATTINFSACNKDDNGPDTIVDFNATLNALQETPPTGEAGTGTCTATYDTVTNELSYTLTWTGLTGPPTAMHFHKAEVGVPGDVEIPITGFTAATAGTLSATATVDQSEEKDLLENRFYVNIHTAAHPGGEIRGQMIKQ